MKQRIISSLFALVFASPVYSQQVSLGVPNISQKTAVWCWAAVAEQIIRWKNVGAGPAQCELVSIANGFNQPFCCNIAMVQSNPQLQQMCIRTGHTHEIQQLIGLHGGAFSQIAPPTDPMTLFSTLQQGKAIILQVSQGFAFAPSHVVVLTGMHWGPSGPILHINDPMNHFTQPVHYNQLLQMWQSAIVVH